MNGKPIERFKQLMEIAADNAERYKKAIDNLQNNTDNNESKQTDIDKSNEKSLEALSYVYPATSEQFELSGIHRQLMEINHTLRDINKSLKGDE